MSLPAQKLGPLIDAVPLVVLELVSLAILLQLLPLVPPPVVQLLHVPRAGPTLNRSAQAILLGSGLESPGDVATAPLPIPTPYRVAMAALLPAIIPVAPLGLLLVNLVHPDSALRTAMLAHLPASATARRTLLKIPDSLEVASVAPQQFPLELLSSAILD